jgi:RNA polymerase sigma-70 factor, ECF subfamily
MRVADALPGRGGSVSVQGGPHSKPGAAVADRGEFVRLSEPLRRELLVYCYRMLGSVHDAEDLVQETYLRAWRSFDGFEGRSSLRAWLYRIATNRCLTALEHRSRRPLPSGLGGPSDNPDVPLAAGRPEVAWLQPIPDALLAAADPATIVASRASIRLALIAALQHLPARQRVVLILRDVLAWRAAEVAELLGTTTAAVKSALQRARARLEEVAPAEDQVVEPNGADQRALLDRYVAAFEAADVAALMGLLREDAQWEMPPLPAWFAGRQAIGRFLASQVFGAPRAWRLVATGVNGQPAFATYLRGPNGAYHAHAIQVLTVTPEGIARVVAYLDPSLFVTFGLPTTHEAAASAPPP